MEAFVVGAMSISRDIRWKWTSKERSFGINIQHYFKHFASGQIWDEVEFENPFIFV